MASTWAFPFRSNWLSVTFLFLALIWSVRGSACPATCNGTNEYWRGVEANGTVLVLASGSVISPSPAVGDVLMIIQMQGGAINNSNDSSYGAGDGTGSGFAHVGLAGQYEFAEVASSSSVIANSGARTLILSQSLTFNYSSTNNNRFQAIRVALCKLATVDNPEVPAWDGSTGGVLVVLADHIRLGNVSLEGKGFRGGPLVPYDNPFGDNSVLDTASFRDNTTIDRTDTSSPYNAPKGEGFIGFPRFPSGSILLTTYPEGFDCAQGAPGNAGGGSNWRDAGGGGGANGGKGGDGCWNENFPDSGSPGLGGAKAPFNATNRIFLGKNNFLLTSDLIVFRWRGWRGHQEQHGRRK